MKRIIRFFVVCLALSVVQTGVLFGADNVKNTSKRDNSKTISSTSSRSVSATQKTDAKKSETSRTTAKNVKTVNTTQNNKKTVVSRSDSQKTVTKPRNTSKTATKSANTSNVRTTSVASRSAKKVSAPTKNNSTRSAIYSRASKRNLTRTGEIDTEKVSAIKSKDYSKCKTVFYECMDEFCANKDANLRRCSCSTRVHEFDKIKKQLSQAEDKMLDFNQRLLIVNLDKEDAAAINVASEGELAFSKKDSSESEKLLTRITDALNSSGDSKINNNLSALNLSLDMDSAWDSVDSTSGIATTSKNGQELYNAALPVCLEMAKEVCSDEEIDIAQSGYKLTIQQDCNTVAKSYNSQYNEAMNKIHESGALLDMARLNAYQQRNSDDVLTCKKKILEQLSDESVCGKNLYKCLDTTGQYINPSTGEAFLSENLYNLTTLLTEPTGNETWAKAGQNDKFVSFLTSKKKFLEPAMEQCQDMADTIWKEFIGDALAQIKLAQNSKLEEIKQSCTTLVAECKKANQETLADFDNRALSTFSVIADTTANALCADVEKSCVSLLNNIGDTNNKWQEGMTQIAANITYDKIIEACTTVGQNCIIQQCNGAAGNFALCEDSASSPRRAILQRKACWNEVLSCVQQAGNIEDISANIISNRNNFYKNRYYINSHGDLDEDSMKNIPTFCDSGDKACLLTEMIWGNCQYGKTIKDSDGNTQNMSIITNSNLVDKGFKIDDVNYTFKGTNKILSNYEGTSLLSWFASNTGTQNNFDSCDILSCPVNYAEINNHCSLIEDQGKVFGANDTVYLEDYVIITPYFTNNGTSAKSYCQTGIKDYWGNCCASGETYIASYANTSFAVCSPSESHKVLPVQTAVCNSPKNLYYCDNNTIGSQLLLFCVTRRNTVKYKDGSITCDGSWIFIDEYGNYFGSGGLRERYKAVNTTPFINPKPINPYTQTVVKMKYNTSDTTQNSYDFQSFWGGDFTDGNNVTREIIPRNGPYNYIIEYLIR